MHADSLQQQPTQQVLQGQKQTLERLKAIRAHAQQLLHQNEQAAQREKLVHGDLVVDVAGMGRLKALGDARVEALREGILRAGLEQALIWERLKALGWDSMQEHQATLTGIKSSVEVSLMPNSSSNCFPFAFSISITTMVTLTMVLMMLMATMHITLVTNESYNTDSFAAASSLIKLLPCRISMLQP